MIPFFCFDGFHLEDVDAGIDADADIEMVLLAFAIVATKGVLQSISVIVRLITIFLAPVRSECLIATFCSSIMLPIKDHLLADFKTIWTSLRLKKGSVHGGL